MCRSFEQDDSKELELEEEYQTALEAEKELVLDDDILSQDLEESDLTLKQFATKRLEQQHAERDDI